MHIFLSYSSADRDVANRIHLSLVSQGHDVFFDREDLTPGLEYDNRIAEEVQRTNLFIFLISPETVSTGRYTLNELGLAQRRWKHPARHVLPVMVRSTPMDQIPPYLKAVTIMQPAGDIPAEVADYVRQIRPPWPKWAGWTIGGAAVGILAVSLWGFSGMSTHVRQAADLLQNARSLQSAGEYSSAFDKILEARAQVTQILLSNVFQRQLVQNVTTQQVGIATAWLDSMHVKEGERFSDLANRVLPTLDEAIAASTGEGKANLLSHRGWADFLRSRDGIQKSSPETYYREALAIDPTNVYAHTMWGHWVMWTHGKPDDANEHFKAALASGRQRPYVRALQFSAMQNLRGDVGDAEMIRVVYDMWANQEPVSKRMMRDVGSVYYFLCRPRRLDALAKPLQEKDHIALLRGLYQPVNTDNQYYWLQPCLAALQEKSGLNKEALATYQTLKRTLSKDSIYLTDTDAAIDRLSGLAKKPR